jgi:hypothetical protein
VEWPSPEPETTKVTLRFGNQAVTKEFRRGFEWERIIDWAEKTWEISGVMHCVKLNGEDWNQSNYIPQDSVIDFAPRFQT